MSKREKIQKTNAMRELDTAGISYSAREVPEEDISRGLGLRMAHELGVDPDSSFKTLVCVSPAGVHVVCCIPVSQELDLKKAAVAADQKSLALVPLKEIEALTGYVRGGCSPVGMKKQFVTLFDETVLLFDEIGISGGKRGLSLRVNPLELVNFLGARTCDLTLR